MRLAFSLLAAGLLALPAAAQPVLIPLTPQKQVDPPPPPTPSPTPVAPPQAGVPGSPESSGPQRGGVDAQGRAVPEPGEGAPRGADR
jgi:hypothetical protein